jgi:primase-polymerase (primpol)-like protein
MAVVGVDADKCRARDTGEIAPWAWALVRRLDTWFQASPTGTGLRGFLAGRIPERLLAGGKQGRRRGPVEVYQGGRYLTLTTARLPGTPRRIEARQAELEAWLAELFPVADRVPAAAPVPPAGPVPLEDDVLLDTMFASRSGARIRRLWDGDLSAHGDDHSRADAALLTHLAWWTDRDEPRMDLLFRRSRLNRDKWDRQDYRDRTMALALAAVTDGYRGPVGANRAEAAETVTVAVAGPPPGTVPDKPEGVVHRSSSPAGVRVRRLWRLPAEPAGITPPAWPTLSVEVR